IPLRSLHRRMTQEQLDLLKLAARGSAQLRAGAATIMRRDAGHTRCRRVLPEHLPDDLLAQSFAGDGAHAIYRAKKVASGHTYRCHPRIDRDLYPSRHGRGPNATVLSNEVHNAPAAIPLLDVRERQRRNFGSPESA